MHIMWLKFSTALLMPWSLSKGHEYCFRGYENVSKWVNSQIWTLQIMRVFSTILFPWFCSIFSVGPDCFPFTYLQKGRICTSLISVNTQCSQPLVPSWPTFAKVQSPAQLHSRETGRWPLRRFCLAYTCSPNGVPSLIPTACFLGLWIDGKCDKLYAQHAQPFLSGGRAPRRIHRLS